MFNSSNIRPHSNGFSLIEILFAFLILTALASISLFYITSFRNRTDLLQSISRLDELVSEARSASRRTGQPASLSFDRHNIDLTAVGMNSSRMLSPYVEIDVLSAREVGVNGTPTVLFLPDGTSSGAKITFRIGAMSDTIDISWLSGRVMHAQ